MAPCTISTLLTQCSVHMYKHQATALEKDQGKSCTFHTVCVIITHLVGIRPVSQAQM